MKLYRILQVAVGALNAIVVALYNEQITAEEAQAKAIELMTKTIGEVTGS